MKIENDFEKAKLVWDEYKYRHEHCWKLIFQITAAVVIVSVVPYTDETIARKLGYWTVLLPSLGIALALFSIRRIYKELALWKTIRDRHISLQNSLGILDNSEGPISTFRRDVLIYLYMLVFIGLINCAIIIFVWIP